VKLAQAGCKVVSTYMDEAQANDWKAKMAAAGFEMALVKCDVSNFDDCKAMGDKLNADFGGVDVLVNNAGITKDGTFRKMGPDQWNAVLNVNLVSVFNVTKQVIDGMMNKGWGRVINISSINGQKGQFGQTNYAAAKAGMHGFTMSLAQETAKKGRYRQLHFARLHRHRNGHGDRRGSAQPDRRANPHRPPRQAGRNRRAGDLPGFRRRRLHHRRQYRRQWRSAHVLMPRIDGPIVSGRRCFSGEKNDR
jgi:NAD(P)-dependent dehydrogenase (short-subunit alcohol dehydrogenase family)